MGFKTVSAQFSASSRPSPNSFNIPENINNLTEVANNLTVYRRCIDNFFLDWRFFFTLKQWTLPKLCTRNRKWGSKFWSQKWKALPGLFTFTKRVPMGTTILLKITVLVRLEPNMTSFVLWNSVSDKRFDRFFLL